MKFKDLNKQKLASQFVFSIASLLFIIGLTFGIIFAEGAPPDIDKQAPANTALMFLVPWLSAIIMLMIYGSLKTFSKKEFLVSVDKAAALGIIDQTAKFELYNNVKNEEIKKQLIHAESKNRDRLIKLALDTKILESEKALDEGLDKEDVYKFITGEEFHRRPNIPSLNRQAKYRELKEEKENLELGEYDIPTSH